MTVLAEKNRKRDARGPGTSMPIKSLEGEEFRRENIGVGNTKGG